MDLRRLQLAGGLRPWMLAIPVRGRGGYRLRDPLPRWIGRIRLFLARGGRGSRRIRLQWRLLLKRTLDTIEELDHENEILTQENKHLSQLADEGMKLKDKNEELSKENERLIAENKHINLFADELVDRLQE